MRSILFLSLASLASAQVAPVAVSTPVTVVLDFQGQYSSNSLREMQHDLKAMMGGAGLLVDLRLRSEATRSSFAHLVVVRFNGKCILEPVGYMYDERGPLAFT